MRGRQDLIETLLNHGVDRIFGNPGTTESPLMDSLLDYPQLQYIMHLHEGVAVGAGNFYAQASGKTAFVNLHVAPGLGNAIGMIYNAMKNCSPMVVTAGQQDTRNRLRDPGSWPRPGGDGRAGHQMERAGRTRRRTGPDPAARIQDRRRGAGRTQVFVALPINVLEQETTIAAGSPGHSYTRTLPDPMGVGAMARLLLQARNPVIVAGDDMARADTAGRGVAGRAHRCVGLVRRAARPQPVPHRPCLDARHAGVDAPGVAKQLAGADLVLMVGGPFFEEVWYAPGSPFPAGAKVLQIEEAAPRLAYNFALDAGLLASVGPALLALDSVVASGRHCRVQGGGDGAQQRAGGTQGRRGGSPAGAGQEILDPRADFDGTRDGGNPCRRAARRDRRRRDHHCQHGPVRDLCVRRP